jgi:hypothetical protein
MANLGTASSYTQELNRFQESSITAENNPLQATVPNYNISLRHGINVSYGDQLEYNRFNENYITRSNETNQQMLPETFIDLTSGITVAYGDQLEYNRFNANKDMVLTHNPYPDQSKLPSVQFELRLHTFTGASAVQSEYNRFNENYITTESVPDQSKLPASFIDLKHGIAVQTGDQSEYNRFNEKYATTQPVHKQELLPSHWFDLRDHDLLVNGDLEEFIKGYNYYEKYYTENVGLNEKGCRELLLKGNPYFVWG